MRILNGEINKKKVKVMKIIKRSGQETSFDEEKIVNAVKKATKRSTRFPGFPTSRFVRWHTALRRNACAWAARSTSRKYRIWSKIVLWRSKLSSLHANT